METRTECPIGAEGMNFLERLFGPRTQQQTQDRHDVLEAYRQSTDRLRRKLDEDPCASDPTRAECNAEVRDALRDRQEISHRMRDARSFRGGT
jgi:hypothetical protein